MSTRNSTMRDCFSNIWDKKEGTVEVHKSDKIRYRIAVVCICLVTACGCSRSSAPPPPPASQSQPAPSAGPAPVYGPSASPVPASPSLPGGAKFLDFNDIPIPREISVQPDRSYVFVAGQIKMGFLTLRGRVDSNSLMNFFASALPHEGWRMKAQFRYNRSLLIFDKQDKVCVIIIKEEAYYTYVEIYVSPVAGT